MGILSGKVALVTGSTSGIGLAIARSLAARGSDLWLNGFCDRAPLQSLCSNIESECSVRVKHHNADLSKVSDIERLAEEVGPVDILVNNAGIQYVSPIERFPVEKWDAIIAINLSAMFHTIRLFLPAMRERKWGRIINISSAHGLVASINKIAYVAAKHGVVGITKCVAVETGGSGVTCNAICPGMVMTPIAEMQVATYAELNGLSRDEAAARMVSEKQPSRTWLKPEEIGELALYMCSDAAREMTGAAVSIDGGWTAQ